MKGLIFRELYLSRRNLCLFYISFLSLIAICILMRLSMLYGNLADSVNARNASQTLHALSLYTPAIILMVGVFNSTQEVIYADYAVGWMRFSVASPVSIAKSIRIRFLVITGQLVCAFACSLLYAAVLSHLYCSSLTKQTILLLLLVALLTALFCVIGTLLAYRCKTAAKTQRFLVLLGILIYGGFMGGILLFAKRFREQHPDVEDDALQIMMFAQVKQDWNTAASALEKFLPLFVLAPLAVLAAGYGICVLQQKRREF